MKDKKAAKKLIKQAKEHPGWYSPFEVLYAKMIKRNAKKNESKTDSSDTES